MSSWVDRFDERKEERRLQGLTPSPNDFEESRQAAAKLGGVVGHERIKGGNGAAPNVLFELMIFLLSPLLLAPRTN